MKQVNREDLLNEWLRYHNTTAQEVAEKHLEEVVLTAIELCQKEY